VRIFLSVDPEIPVPPKLYGGIERIVDGLIAELRRQGHKVGLAAHSDSSCATDYFQSWPGQRSNGLFDTVRNTGALSRAVRVFKPDVVHSFSRLGYLLPLLHRSLPKVMSYQRHTGGPRNRIAAKMAAGSLVFTACSEFIAKQGRQGGGDWKVIPNFVDPEKYPFAATVPPDAPLVFLSRIERIKGTHAAIEIAKRSGRRLIIAGNKVEHGDGPTYWQNEVAPHVDGRNVKYVGPVNDEQKVDLLRQAAALVVPVEWGEPFGIVFVEALACGTPVISCPRGALPEIIRTGQDGFLITTIEEGVEAVQQLSTISREVCRARAEKCFSAEVIGSAYEALYKEMLALT
jgi:glycosyltransferase involved in cell wall biosynthesis